MIASVTTSQSNQKKKTLGQVCWTFSSCKKFKIWKRKKIPSWPIQKLSSDDMVRYAHILHILWECPKKIIGPFLACDVLAKHHANMSLNSNKYYAPLEWIQDDPLRIVVSTTKKRNRGI